MKKKALVEHNEARIQKQKKAIEKRRAKSEKIQLVELISDKDVVATLKGEALNLQIQAFKLAGAPNLLGSTSKLTADQKRAAIMAAVDSMNAGEWKSATQSKEEESADSSWEDEGDY